MFVFKTHSTTVTSKSICLPWWPSTYTKDTARAWVRTGPSSAKSWCQDASAREFLGQLCLSMLLWTCYCHPHSCLRAPYEHGDQFYQWPDLGQNSKRTTNKKSNSIYTQFSIVRDQKYNRKLLNLPLTYKMFR